MENKYTVKEAAKKMNIGYHSLRDLVKSKKISHTKIGKRVYISDDDIEQFYKKNRVEAV